MRSLPERLEELADAAPAADPPAASVAGLLVTTEAMIADAPKLPALLPVPEPPANRVRRLKKQFWRTDSLISSRNARC